MPQKKLRTTMEEKHYRVVRVTDKEFELDNGDVYPIPFELDYTPSVKEFQTMLDNSKKLILDFIDKCQKTD